MARKLHVIKPGEPGSKIEWRQFVNGEYVTRTGEVWAKAPTPGTVYVIPDEPLDDDEYCLIITTGKRGGHVVAIGSRKGQRRVVRRASAYLRDPRVRVVKLPTRGPCKCQFHSIDVELHLAACACDLSKAVEVGRPKVQTKLVDAYLGKTHFPGNAASCVTELGDETTDQANTAA